MGIYETDPMPEHSQSVDKLILKQVLKSDKTRHFTVYDLAEKLVIQPKGTCVGIRKAITELICEEYCPIISTSDGFKWATSDEEVAKYVESLQSRIRGVMRRIEGLSKARILHSEEL